MKNRVFVLRFVLVAALSLVLFVLLLKPYAHVLGHVVMGVLKWRTALGITETQIAESWFRVKLTFVCNGIPRTMPAGWVVINITAFATLVGAMPGLGWRRTCRALCIGFGIFFVWHVLQLSALLVARVERGLTTPTGFARLLANLGVVLPFFAWLFLTRPPQIFKYFRGAQQDGDSIEQS
jgi:hypothetical protein